MPKMPKVPKMPKINVFWRSYNFDLQTEMP